MTLEEYFFSNAAYLPLFTVGAIPFDRSRLARGISINDSLDLYTNGALVAGDSLNLFVGGRNLSCSSFLDLICYNDTTTGTLSLHTIGSGVNDNYIPMDNTLLLYIQCAFGASLPFYTLGGPQPSSNGSLNLHTTGISPVNASLSLSVPNVYATLTNTLNLYTHGY